MNKFKKWQIETLDNFKDISDLDTIDKKALACAVLVQAHRYAWEGYDAGFNTYEEVMIMKDNLLDPDYLLINFKTFYAEVNGKWPWPRTSELFRYKELLLEMKRYDAYDQYDYQDAYAYDYEEYYRDYVSPERDYLPTVCEQELIAYYIGVVNESPVDVTAFSKTTQQMLIRHKASSHGRRLTGIFERAYRKAKISASDARFKHLRKVKVS